MCVCLFLSVFSPPVQASEPESRGGHADRSPLNVAARFRGRLPDSPLHCSGEVNVTGGGIPKVPERNLCVGQTHHSLLLICESLRSLFFLRAVLFKEELIIYSSLLYSCSRGSGFALEQWPPGLSSTTLCQSLSAALIVAGRQKGGERGGGHFFSCRREQCCSNTPKCLVLITLPLIPLASPPFLLALTGEQGEGPARRDGAKF